MEDFINSLKIIFKNSNLLTNRRFLFFLLAAVICFFLLRKCTILPSTKNVNQENINICKPTHFVDCYVDDHHTNSFVSTKQYGVALFRKPSWIPFTRFDFSRCQYSACYFQGENISASTDMIIIYTYDMTDGFTLQKRWPHQLVVAANWEPPVYNAPSFLIDGNSPWNSAFNLTAAYRIDSDIFVPYGQLLYKEIPQNKLPNYIEFAKTKTKMAAWIVSRCGAKSGRDEYVKQMQKVIDVDIYGYCGKPCDRTTTLCSDDVPKQYRYYLAFENAMCTDYVTEKFFKIYLDNLHIIPVARGGFDYNKYLPAKTFINAADFTSATDLALYLKKLSADPQEYSDYLRRKDLYRYKGYSGEWTFPCEACKYLHTAKHKKEIKNMKQWMGDGHCS